MSDRSYVTPQTEDGVVSRVLARNGERCEIEIRIPLTKRFRELVGGRERDLMFAARSRLARLGVDVTPSSEIVLDGDVAELSALVETAIPGYGISGFIPDVVVPGLKLGRLVFCPEERQLSSEEILAEVERGAIQLPAAFSIDDAGNLTIRPHRRVYELTRPLTRDDVLSIVAQADGRKILNRMQVAREVENVILRPGTGVITSCSMFLHQHYVVLDRESHHLGRHLQAIVLDPVTTRGTRVFLEFTNCSERTIVNPSVSARIYSAMPARSTVKMFPMPVPAEVSDEERQTRVFTAVRELFDRLESASPRSSSSYFDRLVAVVDDWDAIARGESPSRVWHGLERVGETIQDLRASRDYGGGKIPDFGTSILADVPKESRSTVLLGYFPNLIEHLDICAAARERRISRLVFRRASYEHGPFLSAKDQSRLADYQALGLQVYWCNDAWGHLSTHVFRGLRGYFVEPHMETRFRTSLLIAIYGSARPLSDHDAGLLRELLAGLKNLFGENLGILTGGGPGAMQQAADIAHDLDLLVGANYIETVDQGTNKNADFYQCFQDISRHNRQRWFEIASFQIFCTGGLGTLEEVGLTLTDMKLGVIEYAPVVFFGRHDTHPYWSNLVQQFSTMVEDGRAPDWLLSNVLLTGDPSVVPPFYKQVLELG